MLSATDGVHAVAYDAVVITVTLSPSIEIQGENAVISFPSTTGHHYRVQKSTDLVAWSNLPDNLTGNGTTLVVTDTAALADPAKKRFYRVLVLD